MHWLDRCYSGKWSILCVFMVALWSIVCLKVARPNIMRNKFKTMNPKNKTKYEISMADYFRLFGFASAQTKCVQDIYCIWFIIFMQSHQYSLISIYTAINFNLILRMNRAHFVRRVLCNSRFQFGQCNVTTIRESIRFLSVSCIFTFAVVSWLYAVARPIDCLS